MVTLNPVCVLKRERRAQLIPSQEINVSWSSPKAKENDTIAKQNCIEMSFLKKKKTQNWRFFKEGRGASLAFKESKSSWSRYRKSLWLRSTGQQQVMRAFPSRPFIRQVWKHVSQQVTVWPRDFAPAPAPLPNALVPPPLLLPQLFHPLPGSPGQRLEFKFIKVKLATSAPLFPSASFPFSLLGVSPTKAEILK